MLSSPNCCPRKKPSSGCRPPTTRAPTMFAVRNERWGMRPAPASIGTMVRTNGMKRAITTARSPRRSKKACARSRYFGLEEASVGLEQPRSELPADQVAELRAGDGGQERADHDDRRD